MSKPEIIQKIERLLELHGETVPITGAKATSSWWQRLLGAINPIRPGYLWIDVAKHSINVQWATGRTTHNGYQTTFSIDFDKATGKRYTRHGLTGAWKSALSMWPVRDESSADAYYDRIVALIEQCEPKEGWLVTGQHQGLQEDG